MPAVTDAPVEQNLDAEVDSTTEEALIEEASVGSVPQIRFALLTNSPHAMDPWSPGPGLRAKEEHVRDSGVLNCKNIVRVRVSCT